MNHEARFGLFFLLPLITLFCVIFFMLINNINKKTEKNKMESFNRNYDEYLNALSSGNRLNALNYGRLCGFSESRITNDLLCLLNNIKK